MSPLSFRIFFWHLPFLRVVEAEPVLVLGPGFEEDSTLDSILMASSLSSSSSSSSSLDWWSLPNCRRKYENVIMTDLLLHIRQECLYIWYKKRLRFMFILTEWVSCQDACVPQYAPTEIYTSLRWRFPLQCRCVQAAPTFWWCICWTLFACCKDVLWTVYLKIVILQ